jgi:hypothetical protein
MAMCVECPQVCIHAIYLIMVKDRVVSRDIAETITDFEAGARVLEMARPEDALRALESVERLAVAFVETAPRRFAETELARAIAARSGRLVFLGDEAEDEPDSGEFTVLQRPFSSEILLRHLSLPGAI